MKPALRFALLVFVLIMLQACSNQAQTENKFEESAKSIHNSLNMYSKNVFSIRDTVMNIWYDTYQEQSALNSIITNRNGDETVYKATKRINSYYQTEYKNNVQPNLEKEKKEISISIDNIPTPTDEKQKEILNSIKELNDLCEKIMNRVFTGPNEWYTVQEYQNRSKDTEQLVNDFKTITGKLDVLLVIKN